MSYVEEVMSSSRERKLTEKGMQYQAGLLQEKRRSLEKAIRKDISELEKVCRTDGNKSEFKEKFEKLNKLFEDFMKVHAQCQIILRKSDKTFSEKAESYSHRSQKKSMASSRSSKSIQLKVKEERARIAELEIEASFLRQQQQQEYEEEEKKKAARNERKLADGGVGQVDQLTELVTRLQAPDIELDTFNGDPLEFLFFITTFAEAVETKIKDQRGRLTRLLKYLTGEPKDLVSSCVYLSSSECYKEAKRMLTDRYGDPYKIMSAYRKEIKAWPKLKANDSTSFSKFSQIQMHNEVQWKQLVR